MSGLFFYMYSNTIYPAIIRNHFLYLVHDSLIKFSLNFFSFLYSRIPKGLSA
ncbi:hypothetical protein M2277_002926 [Paenibacillus sp. LBL]|nr:hypothetical protein [Paenibacillus sp. LBL]